MGINGGTYDEAVRGIWPILIRWQRAGKGADLAGANATLQCVRAEEVNLVSQIPSRAWKLNGHVAPVLGMAALAAGLSLI